MPNITLLIKSFIKKARMLLRSGPFVIAHPYQLSNPVVQPFGITLRMLVRYFRNAFQDDERNEGDRLINAKFPGNLWRAFLDLGCIECENHEIKKDRKWCQLRKFDRI
jgi:hypothetical protein